jgi:hypothetical protein
MGAMGVGVRLHVFARAARRAASLLHLSHLEIREKFLDRLIYRPIDRNGFHRCLCARLLDRPAGFHLEHRVLEHHLLSEQGVNVSKLVR